MSTFQYKLFIFHLYKYRERYENKKCKNLEVKSLKISQVIFLSKAQQYYKTSQHMTYKRISKRQVKQHKEDNFFNGVLRLVTGKFPVFGRQLHIVKNRLILKWVPITSRKLESWTINSPLYASKTFAKLHTVLN